MTDVVADLRYAARSLLKAAGFAVVAVMTLALGIGANVAMFGVIDTVLLRPLPYPDPARLVTFKASDTTSGAEDDIFGMPDLEDVRAENKIFEGVAAYQITTAVLLGDQTVERVKARRVSADFFTVLGVRPHLGRWLSSDDPAATAVLAHDFWSGRFGADVNVIGLTIELGNTRHEIVGVMPAGFDFPADADMWTPIVVRPFMAQRGVRAFQGVGRLRSNTSIAAANAQMEALSNRIASEFPDSHASIRTRVTPLDDALLGNKKLPLGVVFGAVIAILLVAVANVGALTSVRGAQRRAEFSIRAALGAGRKHIVRLIMAESAVLAVAGGAAGLLVAYMILGVVVPLIPEGLPRTNDIALDGRAIAFSFAITGVSALLFGLPPATEASRYDPYRSLKEASGGGLGQGRSPLRNALVAAQVAVTLVLVTGAALLLNSFARLRMVDIGIETENVVTFVLQGTIPAERGLRQPSTLESRMKSWPGSSHTQMCRRRLDRAWHRCEASP